MTYDVQRYSAYYSGNPAQFGLWEDKDGSWVLASDAAEHERVAIDEAIAKTLDTYTICTSSFEHGRYRAIRDCIAAVKDIQGIYVNLMSPNPPLRKWIDEMDVIDVLREMMDKDRWDKA